MHSCAHQIIYNKKKLVSVYNNIYSHLVTGTDGTSMYVGTCTPTNHTVLDSNDSYNLNQLNSYYKYYQYRCKKYFFRVAGFFQKKLRLRFILETQLARGTSLAFFNKAAAFYFKGYIALNNTVLFISEMRGSSTALNPAPKIVISN